MKVQGILLISLRGHSGKISGTEEWEREAIHGYTSPYGDESLEDLE